MIFHFLGIYMDLLKPRASKYPKTKCLKYCDRGTSTIFFSGYSWKGLGRFFFTKGEDIIRSNIAVAAWHQAERWPKAGNMRDGDRWRWRDVQICVQTITFG